MTRDINPMSRIMKTLVAMVIFTIADENAIFSLKIKFMRIIWPKIRSTGTSRIFLKMNSLVVYEREVHKVIYG